MDEADHTTGNDTHPIDEKVHALIDERISAARELADSASELTTARSQFEDAQRDYAQRFRAAEKAGWTRKELTTHLGLEEPARPPRRRSAAKKTGDQAKDTTDEAEAVTS